jgi:hypothetical protein
LFDAATDKAEDRRYDPGSAGALSASTSSTLFMILSARAQPTAWLPLTPRGVASFARMPLTRLLLVQIVFALVTAGAVAWFLSTDWFPVIRAAIQQLPPRGEIQSGRLNWKGDSAQLLADGNYLAWAVDLNHSGRVLPLAQVRVEFGQESVRVASLFGYGEWSYPKNLAVAFNRPVLQPWWGAWETPILWISIGITVAGLMVAWMFMASVYCWAVWLAGFFANRNLDLRASWKLAGAALMPGALLMTIGIIGYGQNAFDLVKLLALTGAHFVVGWIFILISPFFAARLGSSMEIKGNPFVAPLDDRKK